MIGDRKFSSDRDGYQQLLDWASSFGIINAFGVECTGSYGAGLTRHLLAAGIDVVEVNKGHSQVRHRVGKSDGVDAEAAARKVLSGECSDPAKDTTGALKRSGIFIWSGTPRSRPVVQHVCSSVTFYSPRRSISEPG